MQKEARKLKHPYKPQLNREAGGEPCIDDLEGDEKEAAIQNFVNRMEADNNNRQNKIKKLKKTKAKKAREMSNSISQRTLAQTAAAQGLNLDADAKAEEKALKVIEDNFQRRLESDLRYRRQRKSELDTKVKSRHSFHPKLSQQTEKIVQVKYKYAKKTKTAMQQGKDKHEEQRKRQAARDFQQKFLSRMQADNDTRVRRKHKNLTKPLCAFKPLISKHDNHKHKKRNDKMVKVPFYERLAQDISARSTKKQNKARMILTEKFKQCTFQPAISKFAKKVMEQGGGSGKYKGNVVERMQTDVEERQEKMRDFQRQI